MDVDDLLLDSPRPCGCACGCQNEVLPEQEPICADCEVGMHAEG